MIFVSTSLIELSKNWNDYEDSLSSLQHWIEKAEQFFLSESSIDRVISQVPS